MLCIGGIVVLVVGVGILGVKWAPEWLASTDGLEGKEKAAEVGRVRTATLTVLAGAIATTGAVLTGLSYRLSRQGQVTERFTRAVEQLGHDKTEVKVGAIYALERIARDSSVDHGPIVEVLTAYVREHAPWLGTENETRSSGEPDFPRRPEPDVQAALTVLARRNSDNDDPRVQVRLSRTDLRGASLRGGDFKNARFRGAHLEGARLEGADFENAKFHHAHLENADFQEDRDMGLPAAILKGAEFDEAWDSYTTRWPPDFDPGAAGCRRVDARTAERRG